MSTALVLEGGALRGVYTAGVLDILLENDIEINCVIGVSAGALNGMNYVSKQIGRAAQINIENCNNPKYIGYKAIKKNKGLIGFDYLFGEISQKINPFDEKTFRESNQRFVAVATNCQTGEPTFFEKEKYDTIFKAVQASASMPLVSEMVKIENNTYLDGAVGSSIPVQWALEQGYDKIIVVLTRDIFYQKEQISSKMKKIYALKFREYPVLVDKIMTMSERYNQITEEIKKLEEDKRIFVFRPQKEVKVKRLEKDAKKLQDLYQEGIEETKQKLEELKQYLNK